MNEKIGLPKPYSIEKRENYAYFIRRKGRRQKTPFIEEGRCKQQVNKRGQNVRVKSDIKKKGKKEKEETIRPDKTALKRDFGCPSVNALIRCTS